MASDNIIMDGDEVEFSAVPGITLIPSKPKTTIKASGKTTLNGTKVCVEGDEKAPEVTADCDYIFGLFTGGKGTLKIQKLADDQLTKKTKSGNNPIILKGSAFICELKVTKLAMLNNAPHPPVPFIGSGKFIPANKKIKAT